MLHSERHKIQTKLNQSSMMNALRRNQRSITQQKQTVLHSKISEQRDLLSLIDRSKEFSSIFSKHKRSQYSGYKQVNLNKSKIIKFEHEHKEISRYQTPRKYQMNLKNIAKLRKRYSLEPTHFKQSSKGYKKYFIQTYKANIVDDKPLQICSDRKCERQLKQIIRQMKNSKYFSNERYEHENAKMQDYTTERQFKKVSPLIQNTFNQHYSTLHNSQQMKETGKNRLKLSILKIKKAQKIQAKDHLEKKYSKDPIIMHQQQENLCGWQSQSFYPTKKNDFFHGLKP